MHKFLFICLAYVSFQSVADNRHEFETVKLRLDALLKKGIDINLKIISNPRNDLNRSYITPPPSLSNDVFKDLSRKEKIFFSQQTVESWQGLKDLQSKYVMEGGPILYHFNYYQFENFREFLKRCPEYNHHMVSVAHQIDSDPEFKQKIDNIEGWRKGELTAFIKKEADKYLQEQERLQKVELQKIKNQQNVIQASWASEREKLFSQGDLDLVRAQFKSPEELLVEELEYLQKVSIELNRPDLAQIYKNRIDNYKSYVESKDVVTTYDLSMQPTTKEFLQRLNLDPEKFTSVTGFQIHHQIGQEIATVLDKVVEFAEKNKYNPALQEIAKKSAQLCDIAHDSFSQGSILDTYTALDTANEMLEMGDLALSYVSDKRSGQAIDELLSKAFNRRIKPIQKYKKLQDLEKRIVLKLAALELCKKDSSNIDWGILGEEVNEISRLREHFDQSTVLEGIQLALSYPHVMATTDIVNDLNEAMTFVRDLKLYFNELKIVDSNLKLEKAKLFIAPSKAVPSINSEMKFDKFGNIWKTNNQIQLSSEGFSLLGWVSQDAYSNGIVDVEKLFLELSRQFESLSRSQYILDNQKKLPIFSKDNFVTNTIDDRAVELNNLQIDKNKEFTYKLENKRNHAFEMENSSLAQRYQERIDALNKMITDPYASYTQKYSLSTSAKSLLKGYSIDVEQFQIFTGTPIQHQLHSELIEFLNQVNAFDKFRTDNQANKIVDSSIKFGQLATALNQDNKVEEAFDIIDFCKVALSQFVSEDVADQVLKDLLAFGKGVQNSCEGLWEMANHPKETLTKMMITFIRLVDVVFSDDSFTPYELRVQKIEERAAFLNAVTDQLYEKFQNAKQEDYFELAGEVITDIVIQHYALKAAGRIPKIAELASNAIEKVANGERTLAAFDSIGEEVAKVVGLVAEYEPELVAEGIKIAAADAEKGGQVLFQEVEDGIKKASKQSGKVQKTKYFTKFKNIIKESEIGELFTKNNEHIFSFKHKKAGIMSLGKNEEEIFEKIVNIINYAGEEGLLDLTMEGSTQIRTFVNGYKVEIRLRIRDGGLVRINAFILDGSHLRNINRIINI